MTILIAPDAFKDALSASEVAQSIAEGMSLVEHSYTLDLHPMADGGEGSVQIIIEATGAQCLNYYVSNPLGEETAASLAWIDKDKTAVVELAEASGLQKTSQNERDPLHTHTRGFGELILRALDLGCKTLVLTLGGSATVDGGMGALDALGVVFKDAQGNTLTPSGYSLHNIASMDLSHIDQRLFNTRIICACDVTNPLLGQQGAVAIYAPQKGADQEALPLLEKGLEHFYGICLQAKGRATAECAGAGAAGGVAGIFASLLGATLQEGALLIGELTGLENKIHKAQLIITGEGEINAQTAMGKVPSYLADCALTHQKPLVAVAGALRDNYASLYPKGFSALYALPLGPENLEYALSHTKEHLQHFGRSLIQTLHMGKLV